jgi:hypothetical protein
LKEHDITKQGHSEITAIGKALGLTWTRPPKSTQAPGSDVLLVVKDSIVTKFRHILYTMWY